MNMPIRNMYRTTTTRSITVRDGGAGISHNRCGEPGGDADKEGYIPAAGTSVTRAPVHPERGTGEMRSDLVCYRALHTSLTLPLPYCSTILRVFPRFGGRYVLMSPRLRNFSSRSKKRV